MYDHKDNNNCCSHCGVVNLAKVSKPQSIDKLKTKPWLLIPEYWYNTKAASKFEAAFFVPTNCFVF